MNGANVYGSPAKNTQHWKLPLRPYSNGMISSQH